MVVVRLAHETLLLPLLLSTIYLLQFPRHLSYNFRTTPTRRLIKLFSIETIFQPPAQAQALDYGEARQQ
jgi:hypothetical protein